MPGVRSRFISRDRAPPFPIYPSGSFTREAWPGILPRDLPVRLADRSPVLLRPGGKIVGASTHESGRSRFPRCGCAPGSLSFDGAIVGRATLLPTGQSWGSWRQGGGSGRRAGARRVANVLIPLTFGSLLSTISFNDHVLFAGQCSDALEFEMFPSY
jgi:hypothetical protein